MITPADLPTGATLRLLEVTDAPALHQAYLRNREHLRPFEPVRPESFWTLEGQQARLHTVVQQSRDRSMLAFAIARDDRIIGTVNLNTIVLGALRSASVGYWVDVAETGQGLAGAAVAALCRIADRDVDLHRLEASILPTNAPSQKVLSRNGFTEYGAPRDYLHINGTWTDAVLYHRILNTRAPGTGTGAAPAGTVSAATGRG